MLKALSFFKIENVFTQDNSHNGSQHIVSHGASSHAPSRSSRDGRHARDEAEGDHGDDAHFEHAHKQRTCFKKKEKCEENAFENNHLAAADHGIGTKPVLGI